LQLLLDTQLAVWWQIASAKVPQSVRTAVAESGGAAFISRASLWELAIKVGKGNLQLDLPWFCRQIVEDGFNWLDIKQEHLLGVATLPKHDDHKDPFDRLLIAQSLTEPLIFLTADRTLARYGTTVRVV
jgi:PIN domain nuclease of toxin-antitoxin system